MDDVIIQTDFQTPQILETLAYKVATDRKKSKGYSSLVYGTHTLYESYISRLSVSFVSIFTERLVFQICLLKEDGEAPFAPYGAIIDAHREIERVSFLLFPRFT